MRIGKFFGVMAMSRSGHNMVKDQVQNWYPGSEPYYINLENLTPTNYTDDSLRRIQNQKVRHNDFDINDCFIVIDSRDLMNWLASIMKMIQGRYMAMKNKSLENSNADQSFDVEFEKEGAEMKFRQVRANIAHTTEGHLDIINLKGFFARHCEIWASQLKEGLGITNHIDNKLFIKYDLFYRDATYRKQLCQSIGGTFSDYHIDQVTRQGMGSSFDGMSKSASQIQTAKRYKYWVNHTDPKYCEFYIDILRSVPEVIDLYVQHFALTDEQMKIIESL